jgi:hypothetical protein
MLISGTQDRGFAPDRSRRIFPVGKIHSMPSFGRGSKVICPMLVTRTTKGQKKVKKVNYGTKNIPPVAWMFVCCVCFVLSGRSLRDELFTRPEESYRLWRVVVCDQETSYDDEAIALAGMKSQRKQTQKTNVLYILLRLTCLKLSRK